VIHLVFLAATVFAAVYWVFALTCVAWYSRRRPRPSAPSRPVSVLKPLCGDDGHLYENLRAFCRQDHATFEILCGVRDPADPAVAVVERLVREFPALELRLIVDDRATGTNRKVSNLANLLHHAKHETLIIADADIRVGPDYITSVTAALEDHAIGLVTCLYRGVAGSRVSSRLAAMFVNEWFFPSALAGTNLEELRHAFGATIACRRATLEAIGGFPAIADHLADDYMIGRLVYRLGLRIVLSPYFVDNVIADASPGALVLHELRWARTFRTLRPLSYAASLLTFGIPLSLAWFVVSVGSPLAGGAVVAHVVLRCLGRLVLARALGPQVRMRDVWLVPMRDVLSFGIGLASFCGRTVRWNDQELYVRSDGHIEPRWEVSA
jgi:ceramide glucosyltransferase